MKPSSPAQCYQTNNKYDKERRNRNFGSLQAFTLSLHFVIQSPKDLAYLFLCLVKSLRHDHHSGHGILPSGSQCQPHGALIDFINQLPHRSISHSHGKHSYASMRQSSSFIQLFATFVPVPFSGFCVGLNIGDVHLTGSPDELDGGWLADETEIFGVEFRKRWAVTREYVAAMKRLWTVDRAGGVL